MAISAGADGCSPRQSVLRLLAVVLALQALLVVPSATAAPTTSSRSADPATFGIGPARGGKPDPSRAYLNYVAKPGDVVRDHVIIVNFSNFPLRLQVSAADGVTSDTGDFGLAPSTARPTDAGAWITVRTRGGSGRVRVPARASVVLPVRVRIPPNAWPGDHAAGVIASYSSAGTNEQGANVRLVQRIGLRTFVRVTGPLHPGLSVERLHAHYVDNWNPLGTGRTIVTYRVTNSGNVKLGATQRVEVSGVLGTTARAVPKAIPLLLPGSHVDVRLSLPGIVPEFRMETSVHLTPVVPGDTDTGLRIWSESTPFWAVPWIQLAILVLVLAAGGLWWWWRRRRRRTPPGPAAAEQDEIELADRRGDEPLVGGRVSSHPR